LLICTDRFGNFDTGKPYTAAAFFHFKTTGSLERHRAYHAAYEADCESGDLTITVERAGQSRESTASAGFSSAGDGCRHSRSEQRLPVRRRFEVFETHTTIYALIEASTHDDAVATGKTVFDRLVGADPHAGAVFDYCVCFDEQDTSVAGKARWGELPTAFPVDSDDGQDLLERGWEATRRSCATRTSPGTPSTKSARTTADDLPVRRIRKR